MLNQGPRSKFLSGEGGGAIFGSVIFVKLLFVYFIFIFAKQWGGPQSPPSPSLCAVPVNTLKGQRVGSIVSEKLDKM